ncbi:MAG TPA: ATP-binding cassette domain-containing protein [Thermoplasmata archaeon]|jgi:ABC-2 type transport system ATP-binding protein|nr:ATP-binding cassette domain-containing protein [Thermoplasmata archaeon]
MPTLVAQSITRRFGRFTAVDHVSFEVGEGEVYGILGPNGAGKTTTLKMLTTLLPISSGSATVAGFDVAREPARVRAVIGYVPQLISADPLVTGYDNLRVFARLYQVPRTEREARIASALEFMGLTEFAQTPVRFYSGGMIRRLEIAQSMLHRPRILFMDEPTVGLDPVAREAVWGQIERLRREYRTSIVLTTHYMEEADRLCDRLAILHHGRIVATGAPSALKTDLGTPDATLEDVFAHFAGEGLDSGGSFRETQRTRRTAIRLE